MMAQDLTGKAEREERCGNCKFWELSGYARMNDIEGGVGGHHCDGSVSNCRRHAPGMIDATRDRIHDRAEWPTTRKDAWCGDWAARAVHITPDSLGTEGS